jgi:predicted lipoprotein with Yx(FWY)xxD motif
VIAGREGPAASGVLLFMTSLLKPLSAMAVAAAVAIAAGCGSSSTSGSSGGSASSGSAYGGGASYGNMSTKAVSAPAAAAKGAARIGVAHGHLVDAKGRTLYLFEADKTSKSVCNGACAEDWPPTTTAGAPKAGHGVKARLLRTSRRPDRGTQVTYNGHPLYRYIGDSKPGQTNGEGISAFGAKWYMVNAGGKKIDDDD